MSILKRTNRYQAIGNSWAVPVVQWIGKRLVSYELTESIYKEKKKYIDESMINEYQNAILYDFSKGIIDVGAMKLNCTEQPEKCEFRSLKDIISGDAPKEIFISPVGCYGIIRRKQERNLSINSRLEKALLKGASGMTKEEIEKRSRIQKRGKHSQDNKKLAYA